MQPVGPIAVVELFPPLSRALRALLEALQPDDWARPTVCGAWTVKDVAAHLLGGSFSRLWERAETAAAPGAPALEYGALLALIDRNNARWVQAARRISPELLIELLDLTDRRLYEHFKRLDPHAPAGITVAWASDGPAPNWLDVAREYTEKWLHQQHIRAAVGQPGLFERDWLFPVLDTFVRGLPRTFRNVPAREGASVVLRVSGEAGGEWTLVRAGPGWQLFAGRGPHADSVVQLDQDLAWRLFTKGISRAAARRRVQIEGAAALGERVLELVAIMA